ERQGAKRNKKSRKAKPEQSVRIDRPVQQDLASVSTDQKPIEAVRRSTGRPNVLLLYIDDLKPMTRDYGQEHMKTPNFDRLAARGLRFENAYCQVPTCGASRASLMTSLYPTIERFPNFKCWAEKDAAGQPTLPQRFREAGYVTISNGKVFHHRGDTESRSWTEEAWRPTTTGRTTYNPESEEFLLTSTHTKKNDKVKAIKKALMFEKGRVETMETHDGKIAAKTIADIERLSSSEQPFFIACGFAKPHMPFYSPEKTWKPYPVKSIALAEHRERPLGMPNASREVREQNSYVPMTQNLERVIKYNSDLYHRRMRQGYYASVTHADDLLGHILDALNASGVADNTFVVVLGDHGWLLGEHNEWAKNTLLQEALRTALWISGPGIETNQAVETCIEFVDIHPTLCELAKIPLEAEAIDGESFVNALKSPQESHREFAYTRFETGDTISSPEYQYGIWRAKDGSEETLLIDRKLDPESTQNRSGEENYQAVEERLRGVLLDRIAKAHD
ncbi:MAG: sulfatase, partial [Planctomycetota bacterium]